MPFVYASDNMEHIIRLDSGGVSLVNSYYSLGKSCNGNAGVDSDQSHMPGMLPPIAANLSNAQTVTYSGGKLVVASNPTDLGGPGYNKQTFSPNEQYALYILLKPSPTMQRPAGGWSTAVLDTANEAYLDFDSGEEGMLYLATMSNIVAPAAEVIQIYSCGAGNGLAVSPNYYVRGGSNPNSAMADTRTYTYSTTHSVSGTDTGGFLASMGASPSGSFVINATASEVRNDKQYHRMDKPVDTYPTYKALAAIFSGELPMLTRDQYNAYDGAWNVTVNTEAEFQAAKVILERLRAKFAPVNVTGQQYPDGGTFYGVANTSVLSSMAAAVNTSWTNYLSGDSATYTDAVFTATTIPFTLAAPASWISALPPT